MWFHNPMAWLASLLVLVSAAPGVSHAARERTPSAEPAVLKQIAGCQAIQEASARLQCYDAAAAALGKAVASKELYVVEKRQVRETRRSLFGLTLPNLDLFGGGNGDEDRINQIESTVAAANEGGDGNWVVTLADGSVWLQTDGLPIANPPRAGTAITVKRGTLGSFKMNVGKQPAVKVRRAR